jgi:hypothetical protein
LATKPVEELVSGAAASGRDRTCDPMGILMAVRILPFATLLFYCMTVREEAADALKENARRKSEITR